MVEEDDCEYEWGVTLEHQGGNTMRALRGRLRRIN